jgi:hypothetical protein
MDSLDWLEPLLWQHTAQFHKQPDIGSFGGGARRGDYAGASLGTSSLAFMLYCHVWSNNIVRVTVQNVSASAMELVPASLSVQVTKWRIA